MCSLRPAPLIVLWPPFRGISRVLDLGASGSTCSALRSEWEASGGMGILLWTDPIPRPYPPCQLPLRMDKGLSLCTGPALSWEATGLGGPWSLWCLVGLHPGRVPRPQGLFTLSLGSDLAEHLLYPVTLWGPTLLVVLRLGVCSDSPNRGSVVCPGVTMPALRMVEHCYNPYSHKNMMVLYCCCPCAVAVVWSFLPILLFFPPFSCFWNIIDITLFVIIFDNVTFCSRCCGPYYATGIRDTSAHIQ